MTRETYGQFCPVAMASEILASRWTLVLLSEMHSGSTRFNEIRRGVPRMSPALLSKRLKELEGYGVVRRVNTTQGMEYRLTDAGNDLRPLIHALGEWSMRWVDHQCTLANLDAQLLMWNMRRKIDPNPLPARRVVIEFTYPELPKSERHYWLIVTPATGADLCSIDPGYEVDLYVSADLKAMTSAWMGMSRMEEEIAAGRIVLTGDANLVRTLSKWMRRSSFAPEFAHPDLR